MKDASMIITPSWVSTKDADAKKFKTWDKTQQKKWQDDYLRDCLVCAKLVVENGQETLQNMENLRKTVKLSLDIADKIVEMKRKKYTPLSDAEQSALEKATAIVDNADKAFRDLTSVYTKHVPDAQNGAFRGGFWLTAMADGAVTEPMKAAIMAARKKGIDISNEFGKTSKIVVQFEEYGKRFKILTTELSGMAKLHAGKSGEWAAQITQQVKALEAGNAQWVKELDNQVAMTGNKLKSVFDSIGKLDTGSAKSLGSSLVKSAKLLMSSKAKEKDAAKIKAAEQARDNGVNQLITVPGKMKLLTGAMKTRRKEVESLSASLDKAPDAQAAPFRKMLEAIRKDMAERELIVEDMSAQMDEALVILKKK